MLLAKEGELYDELSMPQFPSSNRIPESKLAIAILRDALAMLKHYESPVRQRRIDAMDAYRWLTDAKTDHPFALSGICAWLSLALGHEINPEGIARAVRRDMRARPPASRTMRLTYARAAKAA